MEDIILQLLSKISIEDAVIITAFVLLNLIIGVYFSRGISSLKEYAIGNRNFSTATIVATIVATGMSGSTMPLVAHETYQNGLYFIIPCIADGLSFLIVAYLFAPRMGEFLGSLSIAEAMGNLFGRGVRLCTAISGLVPAIGNVAMQFTILTALLTSLLNIPGFYAVLLSGSVVIIYSTFGGIKAVTFTDVIQFFTFGIIMPMTAFCIWLAIDNNAGTVLQTITTHPLFDFSQVMDYNNPKFANAMFLFLFFLIPGFDPALFQRVSMARNVKQVVSSFAISGMIITLCQYLVFYFIGIFLLSDPHSVDNNLSSFDTNNLINYIIDHYLEIGFKGAFIIGIMAMSMSTADSYINCGAVLLSHDLCSSLGIKTSPQRALILVRISAFTIGILAVILSLYCKSIWELTYLAYTFYMPVVSVPFILAILGFRGSSFSVLLGMFAGFITVCGIKLCTEIENTVLFGMLANIIVYMGSHYLFSKTGGWVGIQDTGEFAEIKQERKEKIDDLYNSIKNFSITGYLKSAIVRQQSIHVYLGFFCIISTFFGLYSLPKNVIDNNKLLINIISYATLFLSTILISYPAWAEKYKNQLFISFISHITIFTVLVYGSSLLVLISHFGQLQIVILTAGLITTAILIRWYVALLFIITGMLSTISFYKYYAGHNIVFENITMEFSVIYVILMASSVSIVFLKPKEDALDLSEARSNHLWAKVNEMDQEVRNANSLKTEFLNNITHEVRTPVTGITSLGQTLWDNYDNIPEEKRKECIYTIAQSSERLVSLVNNILDFSKLTSVKLDLHIQKTNLSDLVQTSVKKCKKLYLNGKDLKFKLSIENDIYVKCDEHYITHTIDNLIINAIAYSRPETTVKITLASKDGIVHFAIRDEGIGIPTNELFEIFRPFIVSSKTRTPSGGRGVGLALCYAAINAHKGKIWAESDGYSWAEFKFEI